MSEIKSLDVVATGAGKIALEQSRRGALVRHIASKKDLYAELKERLIIGVQMANVCHNLSQMVGRPLSERDAQIMRELYKQWDRIKKA